MSEIAQFLADSGYSESIQEKGFAGIVESWEKTVRETEAGWKLTWEDFVNDVDARRIIDEVVKKFPSATPQNLLMLDLRFRAATNLGPCLWGDDVAADEGWDSVQNWYYYRHPKSGFPES